MAFIAAPGSGELFIVAVLLVYWLLIISTAVAILKRSDLDLTIRLLWIVILVIAPIIGMIVYHFYGRTVSNR